MKLAQCDSCGETDDVCYDRVPLLDGGVVIQFRREGNPDFQRELEICFRCREKLLAALPALAKELQT